jgi:signal transduction histidine kinase/CheY-like chemotaxis protein
MLLEQRLQPHLVDLLYRQSYAVLFSNFVIPLPVAYMLWNFVPGGTLLWWMVAIYGLTIARVLVSRRYFKCSRRGADQTVENSSSWAWGFAILSWASSSLWGLLGWFGFLSTQPQLQAFTTIVLTGLVCGAIPSLSAFPIAYIGSLAAMLSPLVARAITGDADSDTVYLLFVVCLAGVNLYYSRVSYRSMVETVQLRFENLSLITQLKTERDKAQSADRAKSRFLAAASHDLRQPIHALSLFNSTLAALGERGDVRSADARNLAARVKSITANLSGLLNALLDVSRLDAGIVTVAKEPVALARLFDDLHGEFLGKAQEYHLEWTIVDTGCWVDTDPMMLKRVLGNLLTNAFHYTDRGRVLLGCRRRGLDVEIQVFDTGIGIPFDQQGAIFDEFYQLNNPARDREKGLGLGLAIVRRTANLLGHPLRLVSVDGRGSLFSITVPSIAAPATLSAPASKPPATGSIRIIVIDDDRDVLDAIGQLLTVLGCTIYPGRSAKDVIQLLAAAPIGEPIDLIIADYRLENTATGLDAIDELLAYLQQPVPAIILTGDTSPLVLKTISESGHHLLNKPIDGDHLQQAINAVLRPIRSNGRPKDQIRAEE